MHFHLPKPLHGWREFAGEIGIIVLGVLIALSAEQVVVSLHDASLAREAERNIRKELAYDSAFATERIAIGDCMRASFTDLRQRLLASGENWPGIVGTPLRGSSNQALASSFFATPPPLNSPHRLWPVSAWAAATSSGVLDHGRSHFFNFAALYAMVDWLNRLQDHEIADHSKLMEFDVPQKLDPASRLQLLRDLGSVDADNADVEHLAAVFVTAANKNGIQSDPAWLAGVIKQEARGRGTCVRQGDALNAAIAREFSASALH